MKFKDGILEGYGTEELEKIYESAVKCGPVRIGGGVIFKKGIAKSLALLAKDVAWAYTRTEDASASMCCARASFPSHYLMLRTRAGRVEKVAFEKEAEVKAALELISEANPNALIGYYPEKAAAAGIVM